MKKFIRCVLFSIFILILSGSMLFAVQFFYLSDFSRAFNVVGILVVLILYSNLLAKSYVYSELSN
jgi:hypothetical protein